MSKKDEIIYALDDVIQSLIRLRGAISADYYKPNTNPPKYKIGELVYAKYVGANVVIEDQYYDEDGWKYKFHGPSAVLDNDYYSTYTEDGLEPAREDC